MNFLKLLVDKGLLSRSNRTAIEEGLAAKQPLHNLLAEHGIALSDALSEAAKEYGMASRILGNPPASQDVFKYIPIDSALHYGFVPLDIAEGVLEIGITDPDNIEAFDALQFISGKIGMPYVAFLITKQDFDRVIDAYQNLPGEVGAALSEYETAAQSASAGARSSAASAVQAAAFADETLNLSIDLTAPREDLKADAPVTKIVSTILRYAIDGRSSDVHIEPLLAKTRVRFRMDGELHTSLELPEKVHEAVVTRVKILAKLRLDEKRKPQDGRFSAKAEKRRIDFRVSTFPTEHGEKVEMRILDQSDATITLESIGLSAAHLADVREMMQTPYGIVLIAGPTGSGKSTTLFAMLSELDREKFNVVSLEDPVEYQIAGVSQSQVRPEIGYTFANGLRSILRQDPDIIMVGEIRDKETAALAVQAALTGHFVLSTIHTNTASGAIPRLIDMGVDPFFIAPTLVAVIGQRLVRKLCEGGGAPFPVTDSVKKILDQQFADLPEQYRAALPPFTQFYRPTPVGDCASGVRGRTAVFEIMRMNKELEHIILTEAVEENVYAAARASGMLTMREDAILKALQGDIPFEEVSTLGGKLFPEEEQN